MPDCPHPSLFRVAVDGGSYCPICERDARLAALERENQELRETVRVRTAWEKRLREALAPFARAATQLRNGAHDLSVLIVPVNDPPYKQRTVTATVGDLRRALAVWSVEAPEWTPADEEFAAKLKADGR
jgi:hypothetical protein